ncbi:Protein of unknown function [Gryllus bimaculatus]|nr:Protein of unknown function [Gryllus bimaculatus]
MLLELFGSFEAVVNTKKEIWGTAVAAATVVLRLAAAAPTARAQPLPACLPFHCGGYSGPSPKGAPRRGKLRLTSPLSSLNVAEAAEAATNTDGLRTNQQSPSGAAATARKSPEKAASVQDPDLLGVRRICSVTSTTD